MSYRFKVWYIPQIPMPAYEVEYADFPTAKAVINALIGLSIFEFENNVKPDYADMAGISFKDGDGEWEDLDEEDWAD